MFLTENQEIINNHQLTDINDDIVLETIIDILQEYDILKTDMIITESNYLISKASGVLTESEDKEINKIEEKKKSFWERLKALLVRAFNAIKNKFNSLFGRSKKTQDDIKKAKEKLDAEFEEFAKKQDFSSDNTNQAPKENPKEREVEIEVFDLEEIEKAFQFGLTLTRDNILNNPKQILEDIHNSPALNNLEIQKIRIPVSSAIVECAKMHNFSVKYIALFNTLVSNNGKDFNFNSYLKKYSNGEVSNDIATAVSKATLYLDMCSSVCNRIELRASLNTTHMF